MSIFQPCGKDASLLKKGEIIGREETSEENAEKSWMIVICLLKMINSF